MTRELPPVIDLATYRAQRAIAAPTTETFAAIEIRTGDAVELEDGRRGVVTRHWRDELFHVAADGATVAVERARIRRNGRRPA